VTSSKNNFLPFLAHFGISEAKRAQNGTKKEQNFNKHVLEIKIYDHQRVDIIKFLKFSHPNMYI
jgi:hypothetical protein